jgi:predicted RNase H-like HicB family nuclease
MKTLKIIIEKTKDHYSAYADNADGVYGGGGTPDEAKKSILNAIRLIKENNVSDNIPAILKGKYSIAYQFDMESLFNYYKGIFTNAAMERITGINQKQIQHYSTGLKKPRGTQKRKIEMALHQLGSELLAVKL